MNRTIEDLCDFYAREHPDLWRRVYPRVYQGVGEFESPRFVALNLASAIQWLDMDRAGAALSVKHTAMIASRAFDFGLPAFFVAREFLAAICQTDLPDDMKWTDAKLPYDAGLLYLPLGTLRDPEGAAVNVLGWCRQRKGEQIRIGEKTQMNCTEDAFVVFGLCDPSAERLYSRGVNALQTPYIVAPTVDIDSDERGLFDLPITRDDEAFLSQMTSVCFSLLLVQTAKPGLVTVGQRSGKQSKRGKREFWTPNFIGRSYRIRREHQGGTHDSPKAGWRRGHFTHQPIGDYRRNPDFVSVASLPRSQDGRINWEAVSDETQEAFWRNHYHRWLEPVWVDSNA